MFSRSASSINSRNAMRVAGDEAGASGDDIDVDGAEISAGGTEIVASGGSGTPGAEIVAGGTEIAVNGAEILVDGGIGTAGAEIVANGDNTGGGGAAGGAETIAGDARWLLGDETGAGSCFLPFLAIRNRCPLNLETLPKTERPEI